MVEYLIPQMRVPPIPRHHRPNVKHNLPQKCAVDIEKSHVFWFHKREIILKTKNFFHCDVFFLTFKSNVFHRLDQSKTFGSTVVAPQIMTKTLTMAWPVTIWKVHC